VSVLLTIAPSATLPGRTLAVPPAAHKGQLKIQKAALRKNAF
jgi:hypothetical protein